MNDQHIFRNEEVNLTLLPEASALVFHPLQLKYRTILLLGAVISYGFLMALSLFLIVTVDEIWVYGQYIIIGLTFLALVNIMFIFKAFPYKGYAVRQKDILYRKGWLSRRLTTVPYSRVQHIDIKQGVLERYFDLSRINVYTAGGQSSDLTIPGLLPDEAQRLKSFILKTDPVAADEEE